MVQKALNAVCEKFDGCETLAYADLSTKLVLATNDTAPQSRDALNELCVQATTILNGGHIGVVGTGKEFRLFLRDSQEPSEGLICVCTVSADVASILPAVQACLTDLASGGADA